MLCGLAEIQMKMSLLEVGVQLMLLPRASFRTMNATPYSILLFQVFSTVPGLVSLIRGSFSKTVHLTSARPRMSNWLCFNSWVSSCNFPQACREWTFHVPIGFSFGSLMVVFSPVAHLSPPPWSLVVACLVIFDLGLDRSGMLFLCCVFIMSFQWA